MISSREAIFSSIDLRSKSKISSLEEEIYTKESNYLEALSSYQNLKNPKMKLVIVSSLNDIINYLENN